MGYKWSCMKHIEIYDKAEEVMKRGIAELPDGAQLYSSLGILLGKQNRLEVSLVDESE